MSPLDQTVKSNELYAVDVYMAVEAAYVFLFKERSHLLKEGTLSNLLQVLEEMRRFSATTSSLGLSCTRSRKKVWEVIDRVISQEMGILGYEKEEERVDWFQKILKLSLIHEQVSYLVKDFKHGLAVLGFDAHEVDTHAAFRLTPNTYLIGQDAYEQARPIVENLHIGMRAFVLETLNDVPESS